MLRRLCRKEKILLFHERTEYPYLNATSLLKRLNLFLYLNIFIPQCDHIFVISTALREFFSTLPKVKRGNVPVSILNMLVEADRYQISNEIEAIPYKDAVYVGTMYGDKDGVYNLIRAFGLIMDKIPEARLILVGDDKRKAQMAKVISALKSITDRSRVVFTGAINRMDVINKINNSYCLALARPDNIQAKFGFPTKLGEYLTTGRPVVVTAVGDIPLFLNDGDNAFIAEPDNIQSFASKLEECFSNDIRSSVIGKRGQELVCNQFSYKVVSRTLIISMGEHYD
jgi:glycosyltransferase involved in cell wall biosynthesis